MFIPSPTFFLFTFCILHLIRLTLGGESEVYCDLHCDDADCCTTEDCYKSNFWWDVSDCGDDCCADPTDGAIVIYTFLSLLFLICIVACVFAIIKKFCECVCCCY